MPASEKFIKILFFIANTPNYPFTDIRRVILNVNVDIYNIYYSQYIHHHKNVTKIAFHEK